MPMLRSEGALLAVQASIRAKYGPKRAEPSGLDGVLSLGYLCWCGDAVGHEWPGKDGGDPHPR